MAKNLVFHTAFACVPKETLVMFCKFETNIHDDEAEKQFLWAKFYKINKK